MSNGYLTFTPGLGTIGVILLGEDRSRRWNGTALVDIAGITSADWSSGVLAASELLTSDSVPTGIYTFDLPDGLAPGELLALFYASPTPAVGAAPIGSQLLPWTGSAVATLNDLDAAWTTPLVEAYAVNGAPMTAAEALYMIYAVCAQFAFTGTSITARMLDGTTTAMTFTVDSTSPTERTRTA
ncbi:MAG TPA: hypothetical protein VMF30_17985 [Pirellulales bacterium]|nr:hypothetical protein [Pirellulales bacterium]